MDDGSKLVARLPTRIAGPPRLTTSSEVATMTYLRSHTSIPIPKPLDWSDDPSDPIGAEYIIMEHVDGVRLSERWDSMDSTQRLECTRALTMMIKQMADIEFPACGSLYFESSPFVGQSKITFSPGYCVGPHCGPKYWKCGVGEAILYGDDTPDCGPWSDLQRFCEGLIKTGLSRLPKSESRVRLDYQGSVDEHIGLLQVAQRVISQLIKHPALKEAAAPMLLHPDFHKRNIFVSESDPTIITGVIDWQSTSIEPAFVYATETPDFASLSEDLPFLDKDHEKSEEEKFELRSASICSQTFDVIAKAYIPKLQAARHLDVSLVRLFHFCLTSWTSSATALREELVDLSRHWKELGLPGSCPYSPSEEQLALHKKLYVDLEDAMKLKAGVMRVLGANPDGYVSSDAWERANAVLPSVRDQWITSAVESGTPEEDAKEMFPFDGQ